MIESGNIAPEPGLDQLGKMLDAPLLAALGDRKLMASIELLGKRKEVKDDTLKLIVRDIASAPMAVVLCSSPVSPQMVARGMDIAEQAKLMLGDELGSVILDPLYKGEIEGQSYTILPYRKPMSSWKTMHYLQRHMLRPSVLRWLRGVTKHTASAVAHDNIDSDFSRPLQHIVDLKTVGEEIRFAGRRALQRLEYGQWVPRYVLMHNDLWEGNILLDKKTTQNEGHRSSYRFVVIDWPGSLLKGYALYDLVRVTKSMGLKGRRFANEVRQHCELLGCKPEDAMGYLLAALGHLGLNLEHFPDEKYVMLARQCFNYLKLNLRFTL